MKVVNILWGIKKTRRLGSKALQTYNMLKFLKNGASKKKLRSP